MIFKVIQLLNKTIIEFIHLSFCILEGLDLFQYFSSACYDGYNDDEGGFYETYCTVFKTIEEEDKGFYDGDPSEFRYPVFGRSDSPSEVWQVKLIW